MVMTGVCRGNSKFHPAIRCDFSNLHTLGNRVLANVLDRLIQARFHCAQWIVLVDAQVMQHDTVQHREKEPCLSLGLIDAPFPQPIGQRFKQSGSSLLLRFVEDWPSSVCPPELRFLVYLINATAFSANRSPICR